MIMTIYVLFADSIMALAAPKYMDATTQLITSICFFTFVFELIATTWAKSDFTSYFPPEATGYFNSFFFWLDIVSLLSLLLDIKWMADPLGIGGLSSTVLS